MLVYCPKFVPNSSNKLRYSLSSSYFCVILSKKLEPDHITNFVLFWHVQKLREHLLFLQL